MGNTFTDNLLIAIMFIALVMMHPYTSSLALLAALPLLLYRKEFRIAIMLFAIIGIWYMYLALEAFNLGLDTLLERPFWEIFDIVRRSIGAPAIPSWQFIAYWSWRSYFYIYAFGIAAVLVSLLISYRSKKREKKSILFPILWMISAAAGTLIPYGWESINRLFILCLVPAAYSIVLAFSRRRAVAIVLMMLVIVPYLPAQYGSEVAQTQVLSSELSGDKFFAVNTLRDKTTIYFYSDDNKLIQFFDPTLITMSSGYPYWSFEVPNKPDFRILDQMTYVIISKQGTDMMVWAFGEDPILNWVFNETGRTPDLTYNNGYYQIYFNINLST
jgi:hypothetical protein